jgi:hypothetical protein
LCRPKVLAEVPCRDSVCVGAPASPEKKGKKITPAFAGATFFLLRR